MKKETMTNLAKIKELAIAVYFAINTIAVSFAVVYIFEAKSFINWTAGIFFIIYIC